MLSWSPPRAEVYLVLNVSAYAMVQPAGAGHHPMPFAWLPRRTDL